MILVFFLGFMRMFLGLKKILIFLFFFVLNFRVLRWVILFLVLSFSMLFKFKNLVINLVFGW